MPSQRPFFLSTFFAAFRQQTPSSLSAGAAGQPNKHTTPAAGGPSTYGSSPSAPRSIASAAAAAAAATAAAATNNSNNNATTQAASSSSGSRSGGVMGQLPLHSPRGPHNIPIPQQQQQGGARHHHHHHGRRRGSDSSSEGFRETLGAEKLYIGGRTATGEEKFFKLGVIRRVRSGDRLSLDRLSL
ncbi:hypothetical protein B0T24DRAFT_519828 [Lasiosphaeria ovina]|uniref:Uncharacterized protein n=1 Tax=Lasiosphaeria ovina TaxID=92902 RepID=A0AAE0KMZ8_9PEZI|nr:hypothetical protein B0T24DRAFT_519828 [Lasiosphaeria ovina]